MASSDEDKRRRAELAKELGYFPATLNPEDIERHRRLNKATDYWLARSHRFDHLRREHDGRRCVQVGSTCFRAPVRSVLAAQADTGDTAANTTVAAYGWPPGHTSGEGRRPQSGCPS